VFLILNLGQNFPKNAYFLEKSYKLSVASGSTPEPPLASGSCGFRPRSPHCYSRLAGIDLSSVYLALNVFYYFEHSKCAAFASSAVLRLFFTSNSTVFVGGGVKIIFALWRRYPRYATAPPHTVVSNTNFFISVQNSSRDT